VKPANVKPETTKFQVGDRVRMAHDYQSLMAVPLGTEGVVIDTGMHGTHIVVDFGHPWGERGCRQGQTLERVQL
jgi:hypothetical protein